MSDRLPRTNAGKEMWRLAEAVAVKLEPDGGGPLVDVAVLAVQMVREQVVAIEDEAIEAEERRIDAEAAKLDEPSTQAAIQSILDERHHEPHGCRFCGVPRATPR